ncbi:MAG: hypothetical protein HYZ20_18790 [Burkholderiales bacterium]|nr:hypothetical protein [Burkholderiales bacterium]
MPALVPALARYVASHTDASDTADGITRWWFAEDLAVALDDVEDALRWMHDRGALTRIDAADGRVRWRRAEGAAAQTRLAQWAAHEDQGR